MADVAMLVGGVERLEVIARTRAVVRLHDKVTEIGSNFTGIGEQLLGLAEYVVLELSDMWKELSEARVALEKVEYHVTTKVPMLGSDDKRVWVGVNKLQWEIIAAWGEKEGSLRREQVTYL